ncbi:unnamed protein product [Orchesella dallaii]|uniref:Rhythmically expressed gene 2 protein n=1 Tax=Orchesella dallaii TaxID=48710 RepID=A0ABP1QX33_9HEXA
MVLFFRALRKHMEILRITKSCTSSYCNMSTSRSHLYGNDLPSSSSSSTLDIQNVKLITFDVTGTLLAFRKPPFDVYLDFGKKYGVSCERDSIKASFKAQWKKMNVEQPHFGTCWEAWWTEIVMRTFKGANAQGADDDTTPLKVASSLIDHFKTSECWMLTEGAETLSKALAQRKEGVAIGIISNFDPRLYQLLEIFNMSKLFNPIILSYEHQISKPSTEIFNLAQESYSKANSGKSIKPSEALHIGDNYELDYVAAIKAGWKSCLVTPNFNIEEIPETRRISQKPHIFADLRAFHNFLENQGKYCITMLFNFSSCLNFSDNICFALQPKTFEY